ncbi:MAG: cache domain-containing protein [Sedimentisphaerales bacterium]|nr:cache domain-containing protein [Sedimentisphaerales bacterium]
MASSRKSSLWRAILTHTIIPAGLTIAILIGAVVFLIVPTFEQSLMDAKRETVMELTNSVCAGLNEYQRHVEDGSLPLEQAQREAMGHIRALRYGPDRKSYFWVNDVNAVMLMHPYRSDLENEDITDLTDPMGRRLFDEFSRAVDNESGGGFAEYLWQWQDDPGRVVPKVSYIRFSSLGAG